MLRVAIALGVYAGFIAGIVFGADWLERRSRISEAVELVNSVWNRTLVYYRAEHHHVDDAPQSKAFPIGHAAFEPGPDCGCQARTLPVLTSDKGQFGHCPGNDPIWERDPVWRQLGFYMTDKHRFKVSYEGEADHFVVRVRGDTNCNGVLAEFSRSGDLRALTAPQLFQVESKNPAE